MARSFCFAFLAFLTTLPLYAAPTVAPLSPLDGDVVRGAVLVQSSISSGIGISSVQYFLDGVPLGALQSVAPFGTSLDTARAGPRRPVFNALIFSGQPALGPYGLASIRLVYENELWPSGVTNHDQPDQAKVQAVAATLPTDMPVCLDIEAWSVSASSIAATIVKYSEVADWIHQVNPQIKLGYYGIPPVRDYWNAQNGPGNAGYDAWAQKNADLAPIAAHVDYIFPSLYTFYEDQLGWLTYAAANIKQAQQYGKPVYPFLWPQYHDSNPTLHGQIIAGDYWRRQIDLTQTQADGTVLWGGYLTPWVSTSDWWVATTTVTDPNANGVHALTVQAWDSAGVSASTTVYVLFGATSSIPAAPAMSLRVVLDPVDQSQAILSVKIADLSFATAPSVSALIGLPSGLRSLSLARSAQDATVYYARLSSAVLSAADFYSLSGAFAIVSGTNIFSASGRSGTISPFLGGIIGEPSGAARVTVSSGGVTQEATIAISTAADSGARAAALQRQNLRALSLLRDIVMTSSGVLQSAVLTLPYDAALIPRGRDLSHVRIAYFDANAESWDILDNVLASGGVARSTVTHFSVYAPVLLMPAANPDSIDAYAYPNPAVGGQDPVIRAFLGSVDRVEVTIFDAAGRRVNSGTVNGAPTGIVNGAYYYDYAWTGRKPSGVYFALIHGKKSDGSTVKARAKLAVVR